MSSTHHFNLPTKACHNCRKRRWRCDRSLPSCQKCLSAGTECLGYGKLFVWNRGVASRGKMMGKGYEEHMQDMHHGQPGDAEKEAKPHGMPALIWDTDDTHNTINTINRDNNIDTDDRIDSHSHSRSHDTDNKNLPHDARQTYGQQPTETALVQSPAATHRHEHPPSVHRTLVDPLVSDLDRNARYYLDHFASQICGTMVVYDEPGQNPIRELLPATSAHPSLLHIMIANSAFHVFNLSRNPMGQSVYQEECSPTVTAYHNAVSQFGGMPTSSYRDALLAKQRALSFLAANVASVNPANIDLILVTILMFVNYALVESGRDKWKVHMDGALKLIKLLGTGPYVQRPMSRLRQTILSDFLVFYILGSTFSFSRLPGLIPDSIELEPILCYAETNNYLSCPGPLLRIMIESFALPDTHGSPSSEGATQEYVQDQVGQLLQRALAFDPVAWSCQLQQASPSEDVQQRLRIASAHRSAVCIYLARVLPLTNPLLDAASGTALVSLTSLADDVVFHISHLKPEDAMFKSICWPLFLAGAESEDQGQRGWIMNALDELYAQLYWGYLHTSKRVLEAIWRYKDESGYSGNCWVEKVKDLGDEILIA